MKLEILVIGLNHSVAPVEVREKITFPGDIEGAITRQFADVPTVEEAMVLSTCNRAEVIVMTEEPENAAENVIAAVGRVHGLAPEGFRDYLYVKQGIDAVHHVFRVASSLDSMVVGESQILGQVKEGYRRATEVNATGPIINRLMHRAFFTAKRVRTETGVGIAAVSVAYVAVELARKILGDLKDKTVLLIGAGEMAELAARHLRTHAEKPIIVVNRTYENACTLAGHLRGRPVPMEQLDDGLVDADVVITSTGSCESLIKASNLRGVMRRRRHRPIFLIDIAIPRDVEPEANEIDGVYLYNIDDLQAVVQENVGERQQEAIRGEAIVDEEARKFVEWTRTLESAPTIIALKKKLEGIREVELARLNGKLSSLSPAQKETVEIITRSIINKIAHDPIAFLKKAGSRSKRNVYLDVAQRLFGLDELTPDQGIEKKESNQE
jgi:glutamyl-tRNA reductase